MAFIPHCGPSRHQQKLKAYYYLFRKKDTGSDGPEVQNPIALDNCTVLSSKKTKRDGKACLLLRGCVPPARRFAEFLTRCFFVSVWAKSPVPVTHVSRDHVTVTASGSSPGADQARRPTTLAAGWVRGDRGVPAPPKHPARAGCGTNFVQGLRNVLPDMPLNTYVNLGLKPLLLIWRMPDESRLISTGSEPIIFEQEAPFCPKAT